MCSEIVRIEVLGTKYKGGMQMQALGTSEMQKCGGVHIVHQVHIVHP